MKRVLSGLGLATLLAGCAAGVEETGEAPLAEEEAALVGSTSQSDLHSFARATGNLDFYDAANNWVGGCTGTLVAADKVLTAAHCLCGPTDHGTISFANTSGIIVAPPSSNFSIWTAHPEAIVCAPVDEWTTSSDDDPLAHSPHDVAVIYLETPLTSVTPVPVFLGDAEIAFNSRLKPKVWAVGYGANVTSGGIPAGTCPGCGVRRSGEVTRLRTERDGCSFGEWDCWPGVLWSAPAINGNGAIETAFGDSGGPLLFNVDTGTPVIAGVSSSLTDLVESKSRWATLSENADFLWGALGLPHALTLAQERQQTAIFTQGTLNINDRAHVETPSHVPARVVAAAGPVRIGVDAFVGEVRSRGGIWLSDRSRSGSVISGNRITAAPTSIAASKLEAEFQKFRDLTLAVTPAAQPGWQTFGPNESGVLAPGSHAGLTIYAGSNLTLARGLHIFNDFSLESNATLSFGPGPTWVFITGNTATFRGAVVGPAGQLFVGITKAPWVQLGNNWSGTLVAPNATVIADMVKDATLSGSFFSNHFDLHQGRYLFHVPFAGARWVPVCTTAGGFDGCS